MVVVMSPDATDTDIRTVVSMVEAAGGDAFVSRGVERTIVGLVGDIEQFGDIRSWRSHDSPVPSPGRSHEAPALMMRQPGRRW